MTDQDKLISKAQVIEIIKTLKESPSFSFSKFDPTFTNGFEKAKRKILEKVEKL